MLRADPNRRALVAALILGAAVLAFGLGAAPLLEPDEGRYADIARAFADHGDWIVPRLDGVTFHDKPPLVPWLVALAFRALGRSELVARLVPALGALVALVAAALLASPLPDRPPRRGGGRAAWLAVLILAASPLWLALGKFLSLDSVFAALVALAWALALRGPRARIASGFVLGLATLTKGPVALVLVLGAAVVLAAWRRDAARFVREGALPVAIAALVAGPWFVAFGLRSPDGLRAFLLEENVARFVSWHEHKHGPFFYVGTALWALAPVATLLALGARRPRGAAPLVAFALVVIGVFTLASSKVEAYILPALPALAALVARALDAGLADARGRERLRLGAATAAALVALAPVAWFLAPRLASDPLVAASALSCAKVALLAVPLAAASLVAYATRRSAASAVALALAASSVALVAATPLLAAIARARSAAPLAAAISERRHAEERVVCFRTYVRGLPYYLGEPVALALATAELSRATLERERPDLWIADEQKLDALLRVEERVFVVVPGDERRARFEAIARRAGLRLTTIEAPGAYVLLETGR